MIVFSNYYQSDKGRQIIYITGASGSGKTYFTRQFLEQYKKKHKDHEVYVFSSLEADESLDKINPKRIKLETLVDDPMSIDEVKDCICVFDDIDVIGNKKVREATYDILNKILEIGRHVNCSCIYN
jgi:chromosomal replication initiation ATPase DnaA